MIGGYIMRRKYFFFDVDGTLTCGPHDRRIVPETFEALDRLRENGHFVCIATGRAFSMAKFAMQQTGITNMVCDGGNGICLDGELVSISPMDRDKCLTLLEELEKKDLPYAVVEGDSLDYYAKDDRFMTCEGSTEGDMKGHIDPNFDYHTIQNFNKIFVALREEEEHLLENINILPFMRYHPAAFVFEPADKFVGIEKMIEHIGGNIEDVVVFGDGKNDMDMFLKAPMSIAMGNAIEPLKEIATYVTGPSNSDGIKQACIHFGWI